MTPVETSGLFECREAVHRVRSRRERYYYFYRDNWEKPACLCFMEREILDARVLAGITAPLEMMMHVLQPRKKHKKNRFSIDGPIRIWLERFVMSHVELQISFLGIEERLQTRPLTSCLKTGDSIRNSNIYFSVG
jgi:hypothetical protein